jgi:hypothetical protein
MKIRAFMLACFVSAVGFGLPAPSLLFRGPTPAGPEELAYHDAEILIYLLPVAKETRARGSDIAWERESSPRLNQNDYFVFWVMNARPNPYGSSTIGYFAVNKHNADVWECGGGEADRVAVASPEIQGVQRILREALHMDQGTVQKYRFRPIDLDTKRRGAGSR